MKRTFCVFNRTRESFMGLNVVPADTIFSRLKGLLGRLKFAPEDGIWVTPSRGVHTIGMHFPIDLVYLDSKNRVIHLIEHLGPFRIAPIRTECASILELRTRTIYSSHTKPGDELIICSLEEMQAKLEEQVNLSSVPGCEETPTSCAIGMPTER